MERRKIIAVLFDIGGPLVDESPDELHGYEVIGSVLSRELGCKISDEEIDRARDFAIRSWAPSLTSSILWQFLKPDREKWRVIREEVLREVYTWREDIRLTEGVAEILPALYEKYTLALAGNQPEYIKPKLERSGVLKYFAFSRISEEMGLSKPDTRFFLEICKSIDVKPENCCMIGDRFDNDIWPANILGMKTIRFRTGPHAVQKPRVPDDMPDAEIDRMTDVPVVLERFENEGS